jgi:hypothetical protein
MAASLRAGRKAEEEARSRTPETEVSKEVKRKKRFVRKRPLYQRSVQLPISAASGAVSCDTDTADLG